MVIKVDDGAFSSVGKSQVLLEARYAPLSLDLKQCSADQQLHMTWVPNHSNNVSCLEQLNTRKGTFVAHVLDKSLCVVALLISPIIGSTFHKHEWYSNVSDHFLWQ